MGAAALGFDTDMSKNYLRKDLSRAFEECYLPNSSGSKHYMVDQFSYLHNPHGSNMGYNSASKMRSQC